MDPRAYTYEELGVLKSQILAACEDVRRDNPTAWRQAHNGNFDETSTRYNDLCVQELRTRGIYAGCNGKRGGDQRSDDVLAFGLSDGRGAQDRSGRFPSMAIIDYIGGAGGPNPSVGWNDVSKAAPGKFLDPQGLRRVDGGVVTPPPVITDPVVPPPVVPQPPPPTIDLTPLILASLVDLKAELAAIRARQDSLFANQTKRLFGLETEDGASEPGIAHDAATRVITWLMNNKVRVRF
jgi:hypothetical protein